MEIFGLDPILMAAGIVILGVSLRTWWGMIGKPLKDLNGNIVAQSFIIGVLISLPIVGTALDVMPDDIGRMPLMIYLVGQLAAVIGIDKGVKSVSTKIQDKIHRTTETGKIFFDKPIQFVEPDVDDDEVDLEAELPEEVPPEKGQ